MERPRPLADSKVTVGRFIAEIANDIPEWVVDLAHGTLQLLAAIIFGSAAAVAEIAAFPNGKNYFWAIAAGAAVAAIAWLIAGRLRGATQRLCGVGAILFGVAALLGLI